MTMRKRTRVISTLRSQVAGSSKASSSQLADELSILSWRKGPLKKAGIKPEIPVGQGLAMKVELSIMWNKPQHLMKSVTKYFVYYYTVVTYNRKTFNSKSRVLYI